MNPIHHARGCYWTAIEGLATSAATIQQRLHGAWLNVHHVNPAAYETTADLKDAWRDLRFSFDEAKATGVESMERGLALLTDDAAEVLARQIIVMAHRLDEACAQADADAGRGG